MVVSFRFLFHTFIFSVTNLALLVGHAGGAICVRTGGWRGEADVDAHPVVAQRAGGRDKQDTLNEGLPDIDPFFHIDFDQC